jgi:hypothetical protein
VNDPIRPRELTMIQGERITIVLVTNRHLFHARMALGRSAERSARAFVNGWSRAKKLALLVCRPLCLTVAPMVDREPTINSEDEIYNSASNHMAPGPM